MTFRAITFCSDIGISFSEMPILRKAFHMHSLLTLSNWRWAGEAQILTPDTDSKWCYCAKCSKIWSVNLQAPFLCNAFQDYFNYSLCNGSKHASLVVAHKTDYHHSLLPLIAKKQNKSCEWEQQLWRGRKGSNEQFREYIVVLLDDIVGRDNFPFVWKSSSYPRIIVADHFIQKRWNFTRWDTVESREKMFAPPFNLLVVVDQESTIRAPDRTIEKFENTRKFFRAAAYGSEIVLLCDSFYTSFTKIINFLLSQRMLRFTSRDYPWHRSSRKASTRWSICDIGGAFYCAPFQQLWDTAREHGVDEILIK